jgi:hypothetical protein
VKEAQNVGQVLPRYGALRRALLPIYGLDQLVFVLLVSLPFACLAWVSPKLALYTGIGAYIGFVSTMQRSTPSTLVLPASDERRVAALLDRSPFFERRAAGEWDSTKGRLHRWGTDNIRLEGNGETVRLTGRQIDLQKMVMLLSS